MPRVSSFAILYAQTPVAELQASPYDLFILEGDPFDPAPSPTISDADVATLRAEGRTVVGYVDVAVADDQRPYWDESWTNDGTDTGTPTEDAPDWLQGQPVGPYGRIVKYWDPDWQAQVIDYAVHLVRDQGYSGVFLDDVGRYWDLGQPSGPPTIAVAAERMMEFVTAISAALAEWNAYVVVNGNPFIAVDSGDFGEPDSPTSVAFFAAIDAMLLENIPEFWDEAATNVPDDVLLLASDNTKAPDAQREWAAAAYAAALIPYAAPDWDDAIDYDELGAYIGPATSAADIISGGDGPNQLAGLAGNDSISAGAGNDRLWGYAGRDSLRGEDGRDTLNGGSHADTLEGGRGRDVLTGGTGKDDFAFGDLELRSDRVMDLEAGDRIRLTSIDADVNQAGNQSFSREAAFHGNAGEAVLTYQPGKDRTLVQLDVDGDAAADMTIILDGDQRSFTNFLF